MKKDAPMSSRSKILARLKAAQPPFEQVPPVFDRCEMSPVEDVSPAGLHVLFMRGAAALGARVVSFEAAGEALDYLLALIAPDTAVQSWDFARIPLPRLGDALAAAGIRVAPGDPAVRVGITGVDAALAGTGSLVLAAGPGKPRQASLLPPVHVAVLTAAQIVPNLDTWSAAQHSAGFPDVRSASSVVIISGPSRTGDIANIPVRGVHGPGQLHIVIVPGV
jgi:L-lactate dehydrogenase complex protein LldG